MTIYVVIVSYNGAPWIRTCLDSIQNQAADVRVLLVDNASTDDTVNIVRTHYPTVRLIETGRNSGFGVGNNTGISTALNEGARYVLLLNQDAYLPHGALQQLFDFMEAHREYGVCSPLHCSPDENHVDTNTLRNYLTRASSFRYLKDAVMGRVAEHYELHGVNAAIWVVRATTFQQVGGFDPVFFMYGEDDDLLNRFAYHKVRFALVPGIRGVHLRQSPPAPSTSRWAGIQKDSRRKQAQLMLFIKDPNNSAYQSMALLLSKGLLGPLLSFLENRSLESLLVAWFASIRVLSSWGSVMSHKRLCREPGPHFLEGPRGSERL